MLPNESPTSIPIFLLKGSFIWPRHTPFSHRTQEPQGSWPHPYPNRWAGLQILIGLEIQAKPIKEWHVSDHGHGQFRLWEHSPAKCAGELLTRQFLTLKGWQLDQTASPPLDIVAVKNCCCHLASKARMGNNWEPNQWIQVMPKVHPMAELPIKSVQAFPYCLKISVIGE